MTRGEGTLRTVGVRVDNPSVICLVGDRRMTPPLAQGRLTGRGSGGRRATEGRPYEGRGGEPLPSSGVLGGQPIRVKVWFAERSGDRSLRAGFAGGRKGRPYGGGGRGRGTSPSKQSWERRTLPARRDARRYGALEKDGGIRFAGTSSVCFADTFPVRGEG